MTDRPTETFLISKHDVQDIYGIVRVLGHRLIADPLLAPRFSRLVKDNWGPGMDLDSSPGRDAQTELAAFAMAELGGLRPVAGEVDMVVQVVNTRVAVEVKRCKSLASARGRVKGAFVQLEKARLPGFLIMDCSILSLGGRSGVVYEITQDQVGQSFSEYHNTIDQ